MRQNEAPALGAQRLRTVGPNGELMQINRMRLTADETFGLRMMARERGTSVQGEVVAAAVIAGRERSERRMNRTVSCISPMDDRPSLGREEQPGLLVGGRMTVFEPEHPLICWKVARNVTKSLRQTRERQGAIKFTDAFRRLLANEVAANE